MEKDFISNPDLAAKMGRDLSDNLYYEDKFSIPAFVRFCKSMPAILRVQYHADDILGRAKRVVRSVCIHFLERSAVTIYLASDWFITVFLKDRGFSCEFTSTYKLFK